MTPPHDFRDSDGNRQSHPHTYVPPTLAEVTDIARARAQGRAPCNHEYDDGNYACRKCSVVKPRLNAAEDAQLAADYEVVHDAELGGHRLVPTRPRIYPEADSWGRHPGEPDYSDLRPSPVQQPRPARLDLTGDLGTRPRDVWADALITKLDLMQRELGHEQCRGKTCELGLNPEKFDEMRTLVNRLRR